MCILEIEIKGRERIIKKKLLNQKGFTLIEIIMVLVILGILSSVALPKYFNLQSLAQQYAMMAGIAEGKARVNQYAAQYVLSSGTWPAIGNYNAANLGTNAGDFVLGYSAGTSQLTISASGAGGVIPTSMTTTGTMLTPGYTY